MCVCVCPRVCECTFISWMWHYCVGSRHRWVFARAAVSSPDRRWAKMSSWNSRKSVCECGKALLADKRSVLTHKCAVLLIHPPPRHITGGRWYLLCRLRASLSTSLRAEFSVQGMVAAFSPLVKSPRAQGCYEALCSCLPDWVWSPPRLSDMNSLLLLFASVGFHSHVSSKFTCFPWFPCLSSLPFNHIFNHFFSLALVCQDTWH